MREVILLGERPNLDSSKIRARSSLLSLQDRISSDLPDALQLQLMHKVQLINVFTYFAWFTNWCCSARKSKENQWFSILLLNCFLPFYKQVLGHFLLWHTVWCAYSWSLFVGCLWVYERSNCCSRTAEAPKNLEISAPAPTLFTTWQPGHSGSTCQSCEEQEKPLNSKKRCKEKGTIPEKEIPSPSVNACQASWRLHWCDPGRPGCPACDSKLWKSKHGSGWRTLFRSSGGRGQ